MQLVSLEVRQAVLGPVLKLVPRHERHDPRILVLSATATNINTNLELPIEYGMKHVKIIVKFSCIDLVITVDGHMTVM